MEALTKKRGWATKAKAFSGTPGWGQSPSQRESCSLSAGLSGSPDAVPHRAWGQLSQRIRSVLISLLSHELQTPLSTIQIAVETLAEGEIIPAQVQREVLALALSELQQLSDLIEDFLTYAHEVWSLTRDFSRFCSHTEAEAYLDAMFAALPQGFVGDQPWIDHARARLAPFLREMGRQCDISSSATATQQWEGFDQGQKEVLAVVNHELRTPLTTLQVCLETLADEPEHLAESQRTLLEIASGDLGRLCGIVRDLELLCRLEAGQICFRTEWVDLSSTLQATLNIFQQRTPEAAHRHWAVHVKPQEHSSYLQVDEDRLMEVLGRLLENACRFTATQDQVEISTAAPSPARSWPWNQTALSQSSVSQSSAPQSSTPVNALTLCIADTGCGIQTHQLGPIFDCFHQEEGYLQRTQGGIGIGLTICKYLVEGMGGHIWAESPGQHQGSQFYITLPLHGDAK